MSLYIVLQIFVWCHYFCFKLHLVSYIFLLFVSFFQSDREFCFFLFYHSLDVFLRTVHIVFTSMCMFFSGKFKHENPHTEIIRLNLKKIVTFFASFIFYSTAHCKKTRKNIPENWSIWQFWWIWHFMRRVWGTFHIWSLMVLILDGNSGIDAIVKGAISVIWSFYGIWLARRQSQIVILFLRKYL